MKLYGSLSQLVAAIFRKDSNNITLRPNQSVTYDADRDVQLPEENANSVLVSKTSPDVLTNKSISGATNTLSNIPNNATTATDANTPSAIVARDASGNFSADTITADLVGNASTATSATSATSFTGSLSGEVTGTQSATVVADNVIDNDNIKSTAAIAYSKLALTGSIVNADVSDTAAIADTKLTTISTAGKVANSATTATDANTNNAIVARDPTGGFSAGDISATGLGVSGNLTTNNFEATGQSLMKFAYINGSTGQGFIEMEGQQVGDIVAPTSGEARLFAGTDGKIYVRKKGSSQAEELGAGGSGEVNLVDNPSDAGNWGVVNATATTNTTAANNPLSGVIDTSVAIASSTNGGYARYRFSMPSALKQRKLKLEWFQIASALASGDYRVEVWTNASSDYSGAYTELSLSTDSSGTSNIPNLNGKYSTTFDTNGSDYYEIRIVRTAASAATIYIANVVCGPGIQPQGAVVGEWQNFTPVTFGATTYSSLTGRYRRVGDSAHIRISAVINVASGTYWFDVPSSIGTIDTTKVRNGNYQDQYGVASYYNSPTVNYAGIVQKTNVANRVRIVGPNGSNEWSQSTNTPTTPAAGHGLELEFTVPIAEWAGSGTVQLAQNDVEYAYNSDVTNTASITTSGFANGPSGVALSSNWTTNTGFTRRVRFQTPIQIGDKLQLELNYLGRGWVPFEQFYPRLRQFNTFYGVEIQPVSGSSTDVDVVFSAGGYEASNITYGGNGTTWNNLSTSSWRLRKSSAGAAVGFGIVSPGTSAGLVSAAGLPGNTTGNVIASGYVGQQLSVTGSELTTATTGGVTITLATLPITSAGIWKVDFYVWNVEAVPVNAGAYFVANAKYDDTTFVPTTATNADNSGTIAGVSVNGAIRFAGCSSIPSAVIATDGTKSVTLRETVTIATGTAAMRGKIVATRIA